MEPITASSSREEVLAAVDEHERRAAATAETLRRYSDDEIDWRGDPPGKRNGCYWSTDGQVSVHVRPAREEPLLLARQQLAGEEDQSIPGWDQGA